MTISDVFLLYMQILQLNSSTQFPIISTLFVHNCSPFTPNWDIAIDICGTYRNKEDYGL